MNETVRAEVEEVREEIAKLSGKIARRIEELEDETIDNSVTTYRNDAIMHEAIERITGLYQEGREICKRHLLADGACTEFKNEPEIFRELDLAEACARARAYLKKNYCAD